LGGWVFVVMVVWLGRFTYYFQDALRSKVTRRPWVFSGSEEAEKMPWPKVQQPSAELVWVPWTSHCIARRLTSVNVAWKLNF
jgi:hypothetical protein